MAREFTTVTDKKGVKYVIVRDLASDPWRVYTTSEALHDRHVTMGTTVGVALLGTLASLLLTSRRI
jgi:hypothetical protein